MNGMLTGNSLEVNAQLQNGLANYENSKLGISFQYPSEFKEIASIDEPSEDCQRENNCNVSFIIITHPELDIYSIIVRASRLDKPVLSYKPCNCNNLKDYVISEYNSVWKDNIFINDNQTTIQNNRSAWQIEFNSSYTKGERYFVVLTINDNYGYVFMYAGPSDVHFDKYLQGFKNMLKSVKFTTIEPEKTPSFMK